MDEENNNEASNSDAFLLHLRPTPPVRRRRYSVDNKPTISVHSQAPKGWDIVIDQKDLDSKKPPLSPLKTRRLSADYRLQHSPSPKLWKNNLEQNNGKESRDYSTPPIPPERTKSSDCSKYTWKEKSPKIDKNSFDRKDLDSCSKRSTPERLVNILKSPILQLKRNSLDSKGSSRGFALPACFGGKPSKGKPKEDSSSWIGSDQDDFSKTKISRLKSPSPPPLPPRYRPSAPPQELLDTLMHHPKPYYPVPGGVFFGNDFPVNLGSNTCETKLASYSGHNSSVALNNAPGLFHENASFQHTEQTPGQNLLANIQNMRNSRTDLILSYSVVPPLVSPGFHVNVKSCTPPPSPIFPPRPPKPLPRLSLINNGDNSHQSNGMTKAYSELALHILVCIFYFLFFACCFEGDNELYISLNKLVSQENIYVETNPLINYLTRIFNSKFLKCSSINHLLKF